MTKRLFLRTAGFILALIFIVGAVSACSGAKNPVVLKVGNKEYRLSDFEKEYKGYRNYYTDYNMYDVSTEEKLKEFQDMVYDAILAREVLLYNAKLQGIELTEEETKQAEEKAKAEMQNLLNSFIAQVDKRITDEKQRETEARANMAYSLALQHTSYDKLYKETAQSYKDTALREKLRKKVVEGFEATDEDALAFYEETLEADRKRIEEDPGLYKSYMDFYEVSGGVQPLVVPEGYIRVKHILVKDNTLIKIVETELAAGKDFDELLEQYGEDPEMKVEPAKTKGYLLGKAPSASDYFQEFKDAALALKEVGDISPKVVTEAGTHFIKLVERIRAREIPYDEVKDEIFIAALNKKKNDKFDSVLNEWMKADYVAENRDLIREVGKEEEK